MLLSASFSVPLFHFFLLLLFFFVERYRYVSPTPWFLFSVNFFIVLLPWARSNKQSELYLLQQVDRFAFCHLRILYHKFSLCMCVLNSSIWAAGSSQDRAVVLGRTDLGTWSIFEWLPGGIAVEFWAHIPLCLAETRKEEHTKSLHWAKSSLACQTLQECPFAHFRVQDYNQAVCTDFSLLN